MYEIPNGRLYIRPRSRKNNGSHHTFGHGHFVQLHRTTQPKRATKSYYKQIETKQFSIDHFALYSFNDFSFIFSITFPPIFFQPAILFTSPKCWVTFTICHQLKSNRNHLKTKMSETHATERILHNQSVVLKNKWRHFLGLTVQVVASIINGWNDEKSCFMSDCLVEILHFGTLGLLLFENGQKLNEKWRTASCVSDVRELIWLGRTCIGEHKSSSHCRTVGGTTWERACAMASEAALACKHNPFLGLAFYQQFKLLSLWASLLLSAPVKPAHFFLDSLSDSPSGGGHYVTYINVQGVSNFHSWKPNHVFQCIFNSNEQISKSISNSLIRKLYSKKCHFWNSFE